MEYYLSYHKIIDLLQQYQQQSPRLNSFGHGDVVYFSETMSGTSATYPFMFATPIQITYGENTTQYQISILFADIVNTSLSNEIDVISDMSIEAKNFISEIRRGNLMNYMDCITPVVATTFMERFNDHVGGVQLDIILEIFDDINACVEYPTTTTTTTCPIITTQYVEGEVIGGDKIRATLWNDSGFTESVNSICDYQFYGTMEGSLGTTYSGTRTFPTDTHQLTWNFKPELQPGEVITGFTIDNVVINCPCVELIY